MKMYSPNRKKTALAASLLLVFTFSFTEFIIAQTPGGVVGSKLWLKANSGTSTVTNGAGVSFWGDLSGLGNNATQATGALQPIFNDGTSAGAFNFNPSIGFNGTQYADLLKNAGQMGLSAIPGATPFTIVAVTKQTVASSALFGQATQQQLAFGPSYLIGQQITTWSNDASATFTDGIQRIITGRRSSADLTKLYSSNNAGTENNTVAVNYASNGFCYACAVNPQGDVVAAANTYIIGGDKQGQRYTGSVAEFLVFPTDLITAGTVPKLNAYLGLKYGITLNQTTPQSYFASNGTTKMWDHTLAFSSTYNKDIFGIGRDDGSGLIQKVSASVNAGSILTVALNNNFTVSNQDATRTINFSTDLNFETFSHNGGAASWSAANMLPNMQGLSRIWKVQKTGFTGSVYLQFNVNNAQFDVPNPVAGTDYYLLLDPDGDGNFANDGVSVKLVNTSGSLWSTASPVSLNANSGLTIGTTSTLPGGVSGATLWIKANAGTSTTTTGSNISTWADLSGNGNTATTVSALSPIFNDGATASAINFNPVANFTNNKLNLANNGTTMGILGANPFTMVLVTKQTAFGRFFGSTINSWEMDVANSSVANLGAFTMTMNNSIVATDNKPKLQTVLRSSANTDNYFAYVNADNPIANVNGAPNAGFAPGGAYTYSIGVPAQYYAGGGSNSPFVGSAAEFIIFPSDLTAAATLPKVNAYLALKYGITLNQGTAQSYIASNGSTKMWDHTQTFASTYNKDIFGIGRDDGSDLYQKISTSVNSGSILTIALDNNFTASNQDAARTAVLTNLSFAAFAHNGGTAVFGTTTGIANTTALNRVWNVQETGTVGNVFLQFDVANAAFDVPALTGTQVYELITDPNRDGNYSDGVAIPLTASGNLLRTAAAIDLPNGANFTIAIYALAPGGASVPSMWLRADAGVTGSSPVTAWANQVTAGNTVVVNGTPGLSTPGLTYNYNPVINFAAPVTPRQYLSIAGYNAVAGINYTALFVAGNISDLTRTQTHIATVNGISSSAPANGTLSGAINSGKAALELTNSDPDFQAAGTWRQNGADVAYDAIHLTTPNIMSAVSASGVTTLNRFFGGQDDAGAFLANIRDWRGPVGELIAYPAALNATERTKIESYLAIKYGIPRPGLDYLNSNGTIVYAADAVYKNGITAIARDFASALLQKQSHTADDSLRVFVGTLAASNQANGGSISNDLSSIVIGNDGAKLRSVYGLTKPATITSRFARVWKVTNTNFTDNFGVEIKWDSSGPFNIGDLRLLVSTIPDMSSALVFDASSVQFSIGSIIVKGISNSVIPANSTRYITIGSANLLTPLPVVLTAFNAMPIDASSVGISWQTSSEINNDHFTVERSADGASWETVTIVNGAGNSSTVKYYSALDSNPYSGLSYYRLKQTDIDGYYTYSDVKAVRFSANAGTKISLYPNPADNQVVVKGAVEELKSIRIFTNSGQDITRMTKIIYENGFVKILNLSSLPKGTYHIKTKTGAATLLK